MTGFCEITWLEIVRNSDGIITAQNWHTRDLWDDFRAICEKGTYEALLALPDMKERYTYDWGGNDGIEIYEEEDVKLAARNVSFPIVIIADNESDCWARYLAFRNLILGSKGYIQFFFPSMTEGGRRFKLRYVSGGSITIMGTIKGSGKVGMRFQPTWSDDFPKVEPLLPASSFNPEMSFDIILD